MTLSPGKAVTGTLIYCWADEAPSAPGLNGIFVNARECRQLATTSVGLCAFHHMQIVTGEINVIVV